MKAKILITLVLFIFVAVKTNSQVSPNENSIKFENPLTAALVGQDGLIMKTTDGGVTWSTVTPLVTNVLYSLDNQFNETTTSYEYVVVGENGVILYSDDSGANWTLDTSVTTETLKDIYMFDGTRYITCGNNGAMFLTTDGGTTWTTIATGTTEMLNSVSFAVHSAGAAGELKGFAVGNNGTILISNDFGATWTAAVSGATANLNSVYILSNDLAFTAGNGGLLLKSVDGGNSWTTVTTGTTENIYDIKYIAGTTVLIATGDNGLIIRSEDLGDTWTVITSNTTRDLFSVNFGNESFGITVGENSTELYTTDGGLTWTNNETDMINASKEKSVILMQNYPNPFNPATNISYALPFNASVSVKIYDMIGREVRTLVNGYQNAGTYSVSFNAENLASGIYFYVLRASSGSNEVTKTMKMILTK